MSGRLSLVLTLLTLVGLTVPALAAEPPKGMVAFTIPSRVQPDAAATYTIPLEPPLLNMKLVTEAVGVFTGENGDAITYQYKGLMRLGDADFIVTGGTGRFKGATGSGRMTFAEDAKTPGYFVCTFVGFISEPIKLQ